VNGTTRLMMVGIAGFYAWGKSQKMKESFQKSPVTAAWGRYRACLNRSIEVVEEVDWKIAMIRRKDREPV
jgi:hypothetical protein